MWANLAEMKILILVGVVAAGIFFLFQADFMQDQVDCPHCLGTGRVLPAERICGSQNERVTQAPLDKLYPVCRSSQDCPVCEGKGMMGKSNAEGVQAGLYVLPNLVGLDSAVFE